MIGARQLPLRVFALALVAAASCAKSNHRAEDRSPAPDGGEVLVGPIWEWVGTTASTDSIEVPAPERYTMQLLPDGHAQLRFDCNRGGGSYAIGEGALSFGPLMSTRMACPDDSLDSRFTSELSRVSSFHVAEGVLYLGLDANGGSMRFRRTPAPRSDAPG